MYVISHTKCELRFLPVLRTSYIRGYWSAALSKNIFSACYISKEASNNRGLCHVQGKQSGLYSWTKAQNQFSNLTLGTDKT